MPYSLPRIPACAVILVWHGCIEPQEWKNYSVWKFVLAQGSKECNLNICCHILGCLHLVIYIKWIKKINIPCSPLAREPRPPSWWTSLRRWSWGRDQTVLGHSRPQQGSSRARLTGGQHDRLTLSHSRKSSSRTWLMAGRWCSGGNASDEASINCVGYEAPFSWVLPARLWWLTYLFLHVIQILYRQVRGCNPLQAGQRLQSSTGRSEAQYLQVCIKTF